MKIKLIGIITGALLMATAVFVTANGDLNHNIMVKNTDSEHTVSTQSSMLTGVAYKESEGNFIQLGSSKKSAQAGTLKTIKKTQKLTIDDYMSMYDSLDNLKAFVNKRNDLTKSEKKKVIKARTQQVKISDELMAEYKKILTEEEMEAYLKAPAKVAVVAGAMPVDNTLYNEAVSKIDKATKKDKNMAELSKKLDKIKAGEPYHSFIEKIEKEKSKLLGF